MTNEGISQALEQLNRELRESPQLDEATSNALKYLIEGIHASIKGDSPEGNQLNLTEPLKAEQSGTVVEQANSFITQFELSHPRLTNALSQVIDRLSDMGI